MAAGVACYGQISKGTYTFGGNINLTSSNQETNSPPNSANTDNFSFTFAPRVGYFVSDNISMGVSLGFSQSSTKYSTSAGSTQDTENTTTSFSPSLFARFHKPLNEQLYLFIEPSIQLSTGTQKYTFNDVTTETDITSFGVGVRPGIAWFITNQMGLQLTTGNLSYSKMKRSPEDSDDEITNSNFNLNMALSSFTVGIQFYPGR